MFRESLPTMRAIKVAVGDVLNIFTGCEKYVSAEYVHFLKNAFFELSQNAFLYNMFPLHNSINLSFKHSSFHSLHCSTFLSISHITYHIYIFTAHLQG